MVRTRRLFLRPPEPADVDALFEIQGDPLGLRHTALAVDCDATASFLAADAARLPIDGFAPWTAVLAQEGRSIGWGGLNRDPREPG